MYKCEWMSKWMHSNQCFAHFFSARNVWSVIWSTHFKSIRNVDDCQWSGNKKKKHISYVDVFKYDGFFFRKSNKKWIIVLIPFVRPEGIQFIILFQVNGNEKRNKENEKELTLTNKVTKTTTKTTPLTASKSRLKMCYAEHFKGCQRKKKKTNLHISIIKFSAYSPMTLSAKQRFSLH